MATPATWTELTRPGLRPGLHVVRRDDRHLQVGLDPPERLVLADRPGLHEPLTPLDRKPPAELRSLVDELVRHGWVVDGTGRGRAARGQARAPLAVTADATLEQRVVRTCASAGV